jgi:hypothetical protein
VHLIDLRTGAIRSLNVPLGEPGGPPLVAPAADP